MLIDTHCHLNHERFAGDVPACLERAQQADVRQMIVVGYDLASSEQAVALAEAYPGVLFAAVAVHPHDARTWSQEAAARLRALAQNPRVVAIGEIGLDFHYDFAPRPAQYEAFRAQMRLAREVGLPVIIHCREAYPETLDVLAEEGIGEVGGVMHCWAGTLPDAERAVGLGMALGFGGTLTFKNAEEVRAVAASVPLEALLVETDAPYLAPVPHRGKRNEPAYVRLVAAKLAEVRGRPLEEVAAITTGNAHRLFPRLAERQNSA
ncbi:MAG TPA: TatD family hydrolase [Chthonomonadaceae bacterium]|nr:TatD family hydrolase [Chthonomonadaceae bacterium]